MSVCANCAFPVEGSVYRNTVCPSCGKELHSCANCRHYAKGRPYDCAESISEPVIEKLRANFCDFFQINTKTAGSEKEAGGDSRPAKDAFDALFGE